MKSQITMNCEGKKGNLVTKFFICQEELKGWDLHTRQNEKNFKPLFRKRKRVRLFF